MNGNWNETLAKTRLALFGVLIVAILVSAASCPSSNVAPIADFTALPTSGFSPLQVEFNASASRDPDGTIVTYSWNFGDGTTESGELATHTYTTAITRFYLVTLVVTDNGGRTDSATATITVTAESSPPPVPCDCAGPDLNCSDFSTHAAAQACYDYCKQHGYGDVFGLDADKDGQACESLPQ